MAETTIFPVIGTGSMVHDATYCGGQSAAWHIQRAFVKGNDLSLMSFGGIV